jgi:hypothetical protein
MSVFGGPNVTDSGLVLNLDAGNIKSYLGTGTTWFDKSGNANNGTLINGPTFNTGSLGSIVFDGVDDYVDVNRQIQFERTDSFTLSAWINTNDGNNNQIINNETEGYRGYQFSVDSNGKLFLFLRNTVSTNFLGVRMLSNFPSNLWCYVTAVYNGSSNASGVKLYINGIEQITEIAGDNLTSTTISNETTWIGRRRPQTQGPFNGKISIVQIYNKALTASEVLQNYDATKSRFNLT